MQYIHLLPTWVYPQYCIIKRYGKRFQVSCSRIDSNGLFLLIQYNTISPVSRNSPILPVYFADKCLPERCQLTIFDVMVICYFRHNSHRLFALESKRYVKATGFQFTAPSIKLIIFESLGYLNLFFTYSSTRQEHLLSLNYRTGFYYLHSLLAHIHSDTISSR